LCESFQNGDSVYKKRTLSAGPGRRLRSALAAPTARLVLALFTIGLALGAAAAPVRALSGDTIGDRELGQPDFFHNSPNYVDLDVFNSPGQIAIDRTVSPNRLYVADTQNNRILGYSSVSTLFNGGPATLVIGEMDFFGGGCNPGGINRYSLCGPSAVTVDTAGNLLVADSGTACCNSTSPSRRRRRSECTRASPPLR